MNSARAIAFVVVAISLAGLTGCTPPAPAPTPTVAESATPEPSATPTEEPAPNISSIVIDGDSVSVNISEGGTLVDIPFTTDPDEAAAILSEAIGEPAVLGVHQSACTPDQQMNSWGGLKFLSPSQVLPPGAQFYATADAQSTVGGITIAMTSGQWVGYDGSDTISANGGPVIGDFAGVQVLAYDIAEGTVDSGPDDFWGGSAIIRDDVVESFSSPIHYYYDC
jgi:hypothetical protein